MSNYYTDIPNPDSDLFAKEMRQPVYAGFWERFLAALIDSILLGIVNMLIQLVLPDYEGTLASLAVDCAYYAAMESGVRRATLGKMALGLQVTNLDGGQITLLQGIGRYFGRILSSLILLIGYFMMLWDDRKQTLHDKMANTLVVKVNGYDN